MYILIIESICDDNNLQKHVLTLHFLIVSSILEISIESSFLPSYCNKSWLLTSLESLWTSRLRISFRWQFGVLMSIRYLGTVLEQCSPSTWIRQHTPLSRDKDYSWPFSIPLWCSIKVHDLWGSVQLKKVYSQTWKSLTSCGLGFS